MLEGIYKENESKSKHNSLIKFELSVEHACELLKLLDNMQISAASLFPAYMGVVKALKEKEYLRVKSL